MDVNGGVINETAIFSNRLNFKKIIIKFFKALRNPYLLIFFFKEEDFKIFIFVN